MRKNSMQCYQSKCAAYATATQAAFKFWQYCKQKKGEQ